MKLHQVSLLDKYWLTCCETQHQLEANRIMLQVIHDTTPTMYRWVAEPDESAVLPCDKLDWQETALCIARPQAIATKYRGFFLNGPLAELSGVLLFPHPNEAAGFDAIPLCQRNGFRIMSEVQLAYRVVEGRHCWSVSTTGPVNALIHEPLNQKLNKQPLSSQDPAIQQLGQDLYRWLGAFYQRLGTGACWRIQLPVAWQLKETNGIVTRVKRYGTLGWKEG